MTTIPYAYRGTPLQPGRWVSWWPDAERPGRIVGEVVDSDPLLILIHSIHDDVPKDPLGRSPKIGAAAAPWCGVVVEIARPSDAVGLGAYVEYLPTPGQYRRGPVVGVSDQGRSLDIRVVERDDGPWDDVMCRAPRSACRLATPPNPLSGKLVVLTGVFRDADRYTDDLRRVGVRRGFAGMTPGVDVVVVGDRTPKVGNRPTSKITAAKVDAAVRLGILVASERWLEARLRGCLCAAPEVSHDSPCPLYLDPDELVRDLDPTLGIRSESASGDVSVEKRKRQPEQPAECLKCVAPYDSRPGRCTHGLVPRKSPRAEVGDRSMWVSPADPARWARGLVEATASAGTCFLRVSEASEAWRPMVGTIQLVSVRSLAVEHRAAELVGGLTRGECLVQWMENRLFAEAENRPALPNQLTPDQIAAARALWMEIESPCRSADLRARIAEAESRRIVVISPDYDLEMEALAADVPDPLNHPLLSHDAEVPVR